jgi:long-subunit fatty acid transport protein
MKSMPQIVKCILAFGVVAASVNAQDFYHSTASARSMGLGGVYVPSSEDVIDAFSANPAGLTAVAAPTLDFNVTGTFVRGSFSNSANAGAPLRDSPGVVPYGAFAIPIGHSRFTVGVGITPELLSESNWNYIDSPGVAGADYGLQREKSAILAVRAAAGVGVALTRKISIGVSTGAVYNTNTLDAPYIFQSNPALAGLKTLLNLHTTGVGVNTSAGAIVRASDRIQFNAAWKSRTTINSTGNASGNLGRQFASLGLAAQPDFHYEALVHNVLPQSVLAGVSFRIDGRWIIAFQSDWINWNSAFAGLPVSLGNGSNPDINNLLGSTSITDRVPLDWKDQFSIHGGVERLLSENVSIRAGYSHSNNPVPASTLSPLTAAIMTDQISAGLGYTYGHWHLDAAYVVDPMAHESVGRSALLNGEYSNSALGIGMQSVTLDASIKF